MLWDTLAFRFKNVYFKYIILYYCTFSGREPKKSFIPEVPGSLLEFTILFEIKILLATRHDLDSYEI